MKNTNDFSKVKVGQKLWSIQLGECEVIKISPNDLYRIHAFSEEREDYEHYTLKGLHNKSHARQSLFWSNPNIQAPEKPEPENTYTFTENAIDDLWRESKYPDSHLPQNSLILKRYKSETLNKEKND